MNGFEQTVSPIQTPALRPYQQQVIRELYAHIRNGVKRILLFAPTGAGKTVLASQVIADASSRGKFILFLVHRDILVAQSSAKLRQFKVNCGFIKAGWQENRDSRVQIASVQTLVARDWWQNFPASLILLDEVHILGWAAVVQQMMQEIYPDSIYIGLTATPWRLNKRQGMGDIFDELVAAPMPHELIDQGFLVKPSYYGLKQPNLGKVKTVAGEFDEKQLAIACDRPELIEQIVTEWKRLAYGRRTIAFAVSVQHSQNICEAFQAQGIPAAHVDGSTSIKLRNQIYQQLALGEILVLSSCLALTEGFDVCSVSAILLCRPTQSKALYFQMVGRGLRLSPETDKFSCTVLDQSGNVGRHGFIEDLKSVSLNQGQEPGDIVEAPKKVCPVAFGGCGTILYSFQMCCNHCGYQFPELVALPLVQQLQHLLSAEDKERFTFYRTKILDAYRSGYAPGWAAMVFQEQYGHWPPDDWALNAIFGDAPTAEHKATYYKYLLSLQSRLHKPESWVKRYMSLEFCFEH